MNEFKVTVKGVEYQLRAYKELRNEWDLLVDGRLERDSCAYYVCMERFLFLIGD